MRFEFTSPTRILFGPGRLKDAGPAAAALGAKALLVVNRTASRAKPLIEVLSANGVEAAVFPVPGEPSLDAVREAASKARASGCGLLIGFGGGSALDCAKAAAALLANGGDPLDYLEVIGRGLPLKKPSIPWIAVPTTAGSGSEVSRNAVLFSAERRVKASLRSPSMLASLAVVDPELTLGLPPALTASTGLDALTQLIEPFVCAKAGPLSDGFCREGIPLSARSLERAFRNGSDIEARQDLSLASLLGGLALANAGLGAVHGFAGPLGGMFAAPHGAACARLLPGVMEINVRALKERSPGSPALARYDEIARLLTGDARAAAAEGIRFVRELASRLGIAPLSSYGLKASDFPDLIEKSLSASSMKANPIALSRSELQEALEKAL